MVAVVKKKRRWWIFFLVAAAILTVLTAISTPLPATILQQTFTSDGNVTLTQFNNLGNNSSLGGIGINTRYQGVCEFQIRDNSTGGAWICGNNTALYTCVANLCTPISGGGANNYPTAINISSLGNNVTITIQRNGLGDIYSSFIDQSGSSTGGNITLTNASFGWPVRVSDTNQSELVRLNLSCGTNGAITSISNSTTCQTFTVASDLVPYLLITTFNTVYSGLNTNISLKLDATDQRYNYTLAISYVNNTTNENSRNTTGLNSSTTADNTTQAIAIANKYGNLTSTLAQWGTQSLTAIVNNTAINGSFLIINGSNLSVGGSGTALEQIHMKGSGTERLLIESTAGVAAVKISSIATQFASIDYARLLAGKWGSGMTSTNNNYRIWDAVAGNAVRLDIDNSSGAVCLNCTVNANNETLRVGGNANITTRLDANTIFENNLRVCTNGNGCNDSISIQGKLNELSANESVDNQSSFSRNAWLNNTKTSVGQKNCTGSFIQNLTLGNTSVTGDCYTAAGSGTVTSVGVVVYNTSAVDIYGSPITGAGTFGFNFRNATASLDGILKASDWVIFNAKASQSFVDSMAINISVNNATEAADNQTQATAIATKGNTSSVNSTNLWYSIFNTLGNLVTGHVYEDSSGYIYANNTLKAQTDLYVTRDLRVDDTTLLVNGTTDQVNASNITINNGGKISMKNVSYAYWPEFYYLVQNNLSIYKNLNVSTLTFPLYITNISFPANYLTSKKRFEITLWMNITSSSTASSYGFQWNATPLSSTSINLFNGTGTTPGNSLVSRLSRQVYELSILSNGSTACMAMADASWFPGTGAGSFNNNSYSVCGIDTTKTIDFTLTIAPGTSVAGNYLTLREVAVKEYNLQ